MGWEAVMAVMLWYSKWAHFANAGIFASLAIILKVCDVMSCV